MNQNQLEMMLKDIEKCETAINNADTWLCKECYNEMYGKYYSYDKFPELDNNPLFLEHHPNTYKNYLQMVLGFLKNHVAENPVEENNCAYSKDDSLYDYKKLFDEDLKRLENVLNDISKYTYDKCYIMYMEITARYHNDIPNLGEGLYGYIESSGFYSKVSESSLIDNFRVIYNKMLSFKNTGYRFKNQNNSPAQQINVHTENKNINNNSNEINISLNFEECREKIQDMSALTQSQIDEILGKVDEVERIVNSSDKKAKKWDKAKEIIKWIADKGVDVGLALLPLLLQIR